MARVRSSRHSAFSRYKRTHSKTWRKFRRTQKKRKMFVKRVKRIISKNTDPVQIWTFSPDSTTGPIAQPGDVVSTAPAVWYLWDVLSTALLLRRYTAATPLALSNYVSIAKVSWIAEDNSQLGSASSSLGAIRTGRRMILKGYDLTFSCDIRRTATGSIPSVIPVRLIEYWPRKSYTIPGSGQYDGPGFRPVVTPALIVQQGFDKPRAPPSWATADASSGEFAFTNFFSPSAVRTTYDRVKFMRFTGVVAQAAGQTGVTACSPTVRFHIRRRLKRPVVLKFGDDLLSTTNLQNRLLNWRLPNWYMTQSVDSSTVSFAPCAYVSGRIFVQNLD